MGLPEFDQIAGLFWQKQIISSFEFKASWVAYIISFSPENTGTSAVIKVMIYTYVSVPKNLLCRLYLMLWYLYNEIRKKHVHKTFTSFVLLYKIMQHGISLEFSFPLSAYGFKIAKPKQLY